MDSKYRVLPWFLIAGLLVVTRFMVPTHIEWGITALQKDMAHLLWGAMFTVACYERDKLLGGLAIAVALFELAMALLT